MADTDTTQRVEALVKDARKLLDANDRVGASKAAREALQLEPQHPATLALMQELQSTQSTSNVVRAVETYTSTWLPDDGKECMRMLKEDGATLDDKQADHCLGLFLDKRHPQADSDSPDMLVKELLRSASAKRVFVERFKKNLTITFERLWELGEGSIVMMLSLVMDKSLWTAGSEYDQVLRGLFQLLLTKLIEAGQDNTDWAAGGIVMLLQTAPKQLKDFCDPDAFSIVLENMDIRSPEKLRKGCMGAMKLMLDVTGEDGQTCLRKYVKAKFARGTNEDLILAFSAASATFPILPGPAAQLFLTEGFLQTLMPKLQANSRNSDDRRSHKLEQSALELISAACQDKACRVAVAKYCIVWLQDVAETGSDLAVTSLAALVLAKTHNVKDDTISPVFSRDPDHLCGILSNMLLNAKTDNEIRHSIEGLSYLSMEPKVKESMINNDSLLKKLVKLLHDAGKDSWAIDMGCLTIFSFLTMYREKRSEEQKKVEQLKAYSEASRPMSEDPLDDDDHVRARCRRILATEAIPAMFSRLKTAKDSHLTWIARTVFAISQDPKSRGRLSQLGAIKALITIHTRLKDSPDPSTDADTLTTTSHALAKILISVNPNHTFSSSLAATTCVRPLADLLSVDSDNPPSLLATFESLLALTNLASMDAEAARDLVIRDYHDTIFDLVLYENSMVSRAATELVCNLMASPQMVALYADGSARAKHRLTILCAVTDSLDGAQRSAAGGALAQLTGWDKGVEAVLQEDKHVKRLVYICRKEHEDGSGELADWKGMVHRGLVCLMNLTEVPGAMQEGGRRMVREQGGREVLRGVIRDLKGQGEMEVMAREMAEAILEKLG
ncbi:putative myosin-binding striated muscle assembly protein [Elsinoe fawcettii]|nr:putative myosin-binding striated muscle assembly protein [Elsinoe fawcettii]